jgi:hypothetical protein
MSSSRNTRNEPLLSVEEMLARTPVRFDPSRLAPGARIGTVGRGRYQHRSAPVWLPRLPQQSNRSFTLRAPELLTCAPSNHLPELRPLPVEAAPVSTPRPDAISFHWPPLNPKAHAALLTQHSAYGSPLLQLSDLLPTNLCTSPSSFSFSLQL